MNNILKKIFVFIGLLMLSACSPLKTTHGNLISDTRFAQVQTEQTTRYELRQMWGPPSAVAPFSGGDRWYYIGQKTETMGVFKQETVEQKIIQVDFDKGGTVMRVEKLDASAMTEVEPSKRKTSTAGKDFTILQQFIGNLGRFNTSQVGAEQ